jgi:tetratricopeptide (TPR) repeat protein
MSLAYLNPIRDKLFKERNADTAYDLILPHVQQTKSILKKMDDAERRAVIELAGLILRKQQRYDEAAKLYDIIKDDYQSGYCYMLLGDLNSARDKWRHLLEVRQNHWAVSLFGLVSRQLMTFPTMFQIRNHIESDIANLIIANQLPLLENLLAYADFLCQLNLESYKFIGRALFNIGWLDRCSDYLLKAQSTLPNDPEIYYHLGQYSEARGSYEDARIVLNQRLLISPSYSPAKDLLKKISS